MNTRTANTMTDTKAINDYVAKYAELCLMIENISEFVNSMPAPDEDGDDGRNIPGVDYAWLGSVNELHAQLVVASEICDQLSE